jgi:hypothetical protein
MTFEGIRNSEYKNLYGISRQIRFLWYFSLVFILEFSFEGIRNSVYAKLYGILRKIVYSVEFRDILRNFVVLYGKQFCGITQNKVNSVKKLIIPRNSKKALPEKPYERGVCCVHERDWRRTVHMNEREVQ